MSSSHDITLTPQEQALIMRLKSFRVPEMAHILEEQLKDPNADLNTFMERMTAMVDAEWQARADKRFNRLMKEAHLRYPAADLDETIYRPERQLDTQTIERLSTCHWIEEGKNLIVTGSSASGKTYLVTNHQFNWWFDFSPPKGYITTRPTGRCHKHFYWSAIKRHLLNLLFLNPLLAL